MSLLRVVVVGVVLPVVLLAGVIASVVVVPGVGLAANSAVEVLDANGDRPLAGATRYDTAALIAQAFVDESLIENGHTVTNVIVVSGVGFADALSAAALAGIQRAPILLTPPGFLASVVRSFIERNNINTVYIIGGTSAISESVSDSLSALAGVAVARLSGASRYETALRVAEGVGGVSGDALGTYCNTRYRSVLLANGEGFADALAGGPLAYSNQLPILLTPASGLPDEVATYLQTARVERVIILGGTSVVTAAIEAQIRNLGIAVTRHAGQDRFATAIAITSALTVGLENCDWEATDFGLTNGRTPYDALAGSALLGLRQNALLLTERDQLPTATTDYLGATPTTSQGELVNISFTTLGGTNSITPSVLTQAINAAAATSSVETIGAEIVGYPNEFRFVVNFAEEVDPGTAVLMGAYQIDGAQLSDKYTLTYYPADLDADNPKPHVLVDLCCDRLAASSTISVVARTIRAPTYEQGDNRFVAGITYQVPATRPQP